MITKRSLLGNSAKIIFTIVLLAAGLSVQAEDRFKVSADGQEVTDSKTNLVWRRCVEGMTWDNTKCSGKAQKMNYKAAQKLAASQSTPAWRIPTKEELLSLVDKTSKKKPRIDTAAFPNTPSGLTWATRPETKDNLNAWMVDFRNGHVFGNNGSKTPVLRLVRAAS
jgi:hypothetical protein